MLCGLVTREDHFSPAVASAEVIRVVPPFMAIPASAGIFFLYREHPRSVRLEIWDPYYTLAEKKNGLRTSFPGRRDRLFPMVRATGLEPARG